MAAARLDIPAILVNSGPMHTGIFNGKSVAAYMLLEAETARGEGELTEKQLSELENAACPTYGSCSILGTANTMSCVAETLGMSLPGAGTIPATDSARKRLAYESGRTTYGTHSRRSHC